MWKAGNTMSLLKTKQEQKLQILNYKMKELSKILKDQRRRPLDWLPVFRIDYDKSSG